VWVVSIDMSQRYRSVTAPFLNALDPSVGTNEVDPSETRFEHSRDEKQSLGSGTLAKVSPTPTNDRSRSW
jgi:hypothetical protein